MTIQLKPDVERFINDMVKFGEFATVEDAANALLDKLRLDNEASKREELRQLLAEGIAEDGRGESEPMDAMEILAEVEAEARAEEAGAA